ncbi:MAG: hypothetical protein JWP12_1012 [Bacteroidetes bacterium]|nr:hypothetical protein [Bacteroidota bacterium]
MNISTKGFFLFILCCLAASFANAQSVGGNTSGGATYCSSVNSGFISVTGYTGTIITWEASIDGTTWVGTGNTTPAQSYSSLSQTTCYRVIVQSGAFPPDTSTITCITVYQPSVGGNVTGGGTFCVTSGPGTLNLSGNTGNVSFWEYSTDGGATWVNVPDTTTALTYSGITQNTIYRAVVQNGPACPSDTSSQVSFNIDAASDAGTISGSDTVCFGSNSGTLTLSGTVGTITGWISSSDFGVTWQPVANTTATLNYSNLTQTTLYKATAQSGTCGANTSLPAEIIVVTPAPVSAGNDTTITSGQSAVLHGMGTGSVFWTPAASLNNNTIFTPQATPSSTTTYIMAVTDGFGCINTDAVTVNVIIPVFNGMVANLISPNGDGINDSWYIQDLSSFPDNEVHIYNIYGNEVYTKKGYANDWKGTYNGADLPDGTYYYTLKLDSSNLVIKGSIDLVRSK